MHYTFYPKNVCSDRIDVDVEDGVIHNLTYRGGCSGNLKALGVLCEGMQAEEVIRKFSGIRCGAKVTSCSDQLAQNLKQALSL